MLQLKRKLKIILKSVLYTCVLWFLMRYLTLLQFYQPVHAYFEINDLFFYKRFFQHRLGATLEPLQDLVIIDSVDPKEERSRGEYAEIINRLNRGDAAAACIGVDIRFVGNKNHDRQGEKALVEAVRNFPRTILPINFNVNGNNDVELSGWAKDYIRRYALPDSVSEAFFRKLHAEHVELPFDSLLFVSEYFGHINFVSERYHLFPLVIEYDNFTYPAFSYQVAQAYQQYHGKRMDISTIPTTYLSQIFVNFVPKEAFEYKTLDEALEILDNQPGRFQGKIVLLVNSSVELSLADTPLGRAPYPRWAQLASMISQLLQDRYIESPWLGSLILSIMVLFASLIWILFLSERFSERWRKIRWSNLLGITVIISLTYLGMQLEIWVGVVIPALIYTVGLAAIRDDVHKIYEVPEYENFSITVTEAQRGQYPVSIAYSPAGEDDEKISFSAFFKTRNVAKILSKFQNLEAERLDILDLGKQLYDAIFQKSIETRLFQSLGLVKHEKKHLRIRLRLDAPELSLLPWEYMYCENLPIGFMALDSNISFTRYIPFAQLSEPKEFRSPLRILVVIAKPKDFFELDTTDERMNIERSLNTLRSLRQVKLTFCENATLEKLAHEIAGGNYHVLHYIGHSKFDTEKGEGFLILEDGNGQSQEIEAEAIGRNLQNSSIRLMVLNSCEGAVAPVSSAFYGVAQKLVKVGVTAVVAMQHPVFDDIAIQFSKAFYSSFLSNFSIDEAVSAARHAIMNRVGVGRQDWGTPVLFLRSHGGILFDFMP